MSRMAVLAAAIWLALALTAAWMGEWWLAQACAVVALVAAATGMVKEGDNA